MVVNDNACELDKRGALESIASNRASTGCSYSFPGMREEPNFCGELRPCTEVSKGGGMRFYLMHLTIPGKLDVMGAALSGLEVFTGSDAGLFEKTMEHAALHRATDPVRPELSGSDDQSAGCKGARAVKKWRFA
jgi:hypothetical protein